MAARPRVGGRLIAIAATTALAVGVVVLATMALQRGEGTGVSGIASPAPSFTFGDLATESPTPSPTPTAEAAPAESADERFLAIDGSQLWRATAGSCAASAPVAPVVEMSTDGGRTWTDVTPPDARQVLNVAAFGAAGQGEVIAATGDACTPTALRTYTAGRAWEAYPDVLAASTYVSPADRSSVVVAGSASAAPCTDARSARTSRTATGIVCGGTAYLRDGGTWTALTDRAVALDAVSGTIVVGHVSTACLGGITVTRFTGATPTELGCVSNVDATASAALSVLDADLAFWSGEAVAGLD